MLHIFYLAGILLVGAPTPNLADISAVPPSIALPDDPAVQQSSAQQDPPAAAAPVLQPSAPKPETSEDQLRAEEKQRILGIMATFNTTNNKQALPLTPRQKFQLFLKGSTDPWTIGLTAFSAGVGQAEDSPPEWQGGIVGYSKRLTAGYADTFDGNLWGNAILTTWWHEDPRYYRKGEGSFTSRAFWAAGSSFWAKRDNGTWGPNYANVVGNLVGGAIANAYYPASQRGLDPTLEHSATVTYYGILGAEVIEFWPDIANHYIRKHREKLAHQAGQQQTAQTEP